MTEKKVFSQANEQIIIEEFFNAHPPRYRYFVDVGACEQALSNTAALVFAGWSGLLLEPSPAFYTTLVKQWKAHPVEILNVAAGDQNGELDFYIHTGMGHDSLLFEWYPQDRSPKVIKVMVRELPGILSDRKIPHDFDLLSIDTEGYDKIIIQNLFAKSLYRPTLIIVEKTAFASNHDPFKQNGYRLLHEEGSGPWSNLFFTKV
jgi:FkbM family methyltransferase